MLSVENEIICGEKEVTSDWIYHKTGPEGNPRKVLEGSNFRGEVLMAAQSLDLPPYQSRGKREQSGERRFARRNVRDDISVAQELDSHPADKLPGRHK